MQGFLRDWADLTDRERNLVMYGTTVLWSFNLPLWLPFPAWLLGAVVVGVGVAEAKRALDRRAGLR